MKNFMVIWRRELASCFLSPVAYVFMVVFLAMTGWVFVQMVEGHVDSYLSPAELLFKVIVYFWLPILVTVITMRLFSEEKRSGTLETLLTAPVTESEVVWGKHAGALSFLLIATAPALGFLPLLKLFSPGLPAVDMGQLLGGALFFTLLAAFCVAMGLVMSLLTRNQITAAICCFCGVLVPLMAGYMVSFLPLGSEALVSYVSVHDHLIGFARGSIDSRPILLYLSGTWFLLFAATRILESRQWK